MTRPARDRAPGPRHARHRAPACGPAARSRRWTRAAAAVAAPLAVIAWAVVPPAAAAGDAQLRQQQQQLDADAAADQEALDATTEAAAAAQAELDGLTARQPAAQAALDQAQADLARAQALDADLASRLAATEQTEAAATAALAESATAVDETSGSLARIAAQAYRTSGLDTGLAVVLDSTSPSDFTDRYVMMDAALRTQSTALSRLQQQRAVQDNQQARLTAVRELVADLRRQAADNLVVSAGAETAAASAKAELDGLAQAQAAAVATLEQEKVQYVAEVAAAQAASDEIDAELQRRAAAAEAAEKAAAEKAAAEARAAADAAAAAAAAAAAERGSSGGGSSTPAPAPAPAPQAPSTSGSSSAKLASPLRGGFTVTSPFGYRIHPVYGVRRLHAGTDMRAACGTPVYAAASGEVVRAGVASGYGNLLVIDNGRIAGQSVATAYAHLSRFVVAPGAQVSQGQLVAYSGSTGVGTACHLHFEVRISGTAVNAMGGWL